MYLTSITIYLHPDRNDIRYFQRKRDTELISFKLRQNHSETHKAALENFCIRSQNKFDAMFFDFFDPALKYGVKAF